MGTLEEIVYGIAMQASSASPRSKAQAIYDWMGKNIEYDYERYRAIEAGEDDGHPNHPLTTLKRKKGVCGDQACLYVALARRMGLACWYARVTRDHYGKNVNHACAIVALPEGYLQVDPAYRIFDARHQQYYFEELPELNDFAKSETQYQQSYVSQSNSSSYSQSSYTPQRFTGTFELLDRWTWKPFLFGIMTAVLAGLGIYGVYTESPVFGNLRGRVEHRATASGSTFHTKHGEACFIVDPTAQQSWNEAIFYKEAVNSTLSDQKLLDEYLAADKDGNNWLSAQEVWDARTAARDAYLRSRR